MSAKFNEQEMALREFQEKELTEKLEEFEKSYPQNPKPSVDILNLNKVLEQAVKQKEYLANYLVSLKLIIFKFI